METSPVIQELVAYTNSWQKINKNILDLREEEENFYFFWLYFLKRGGEYCRFFSTKRPNFQAKLIFEQRK